MNGGELSACSIEELFEFSVGQLGEGADRSEMVVDLLDHALSQRGQRDPKTADAPRRGESTDDRRWAGVSADRNMVGGEAEQIQVDHRTTVHRRHDRRPGEAPPPDRTRHP